VSPLFSNRGGVFPIVKHYSVTEANNLENLLLIQDKKLAKQHTENWKNHAQHSQIYGERVMNKQEFGDNKATFDRRHSNEHD
jgi:hypothetical protein